MEGDHKHKIMDRPFMPKYGTVSQVLLQLVVVLEAREKLPGDEVTHMGFSDI